jgi:hypothetical protein
MGSSRTGDSRIGPLSRRVGEEEALELSRALEERTPAGVVAQAEKTSAQPSAEMYAVKALPLTASPLP